jgi:glutamyl-Q tRNA(Asp) synthetase
MQQVLTEAVGDFVLRRAAGMFAYQLAVVVDDAASGINQVVRGADLLSSTPRQIFLHACLGSPVPEYIHLPLLTDRHGEKISKRHGAVSFDPGANPSALIVRALNLLGQVVPEKIAQSPPAEVLEWACRYIDRKRIPAGPQGLVLDDLLI